MNNLVLGLLVLLIIALVGYYFTMVDEPINNQSVDEIVHQQQQQLVHQQQHQQQVVQNQQHQQQVVQNQQQKLDQQNSMNNNKSKVLPQTLNTGNVYNRLDLNKLNGNSCYSHNQCVGRTLDKFYCGSDRTCKMCPKDILNKRMFLVNRNTVDGMYPPTCRNLNEISCNSNDNCAPGNYCSKSNFGQVCTPCQACTLYNDGIDGNCGYRCAPGVRIIEEPKASNQVQLDDNTFNYNYDDTSVENNETQPIADITGPVQYTTAALPTTTAGLVPTTAGLVPTTAGLAPTTPVVSYNIQ